MRLERLELTNFLSYGHAVLDFNGLQSLVITGGNGSGKSSLIDAVTYAAWGASRAKSDDSLVRLGQTECVVKLEFSVNGTHYRIERSRRLTGRGVTKLHFERLDGDTVTSLDGGNSRDTQERIIAALGGCTYLLATNTSLMVQGGSATFTSATPGERRNVLYSLLGLTRFDARREAAKGKREAIELEIAKAADGLVFHQERAATLPDAKAASEAASAEAMRTATLASEAATVLRLANEALQEAREAHADVRRQSEAADRMRAEWKQSEQAYAAMRGELETLDYSLSIDVGDFLVPSPDEIAALRDAEAKAEAEVTRLRARYDEANAALATAKEAAISAKNEADRATVAARTAYDQGRSEANAAVLAARGQVAQAKGAFATAEATAKEAHSVAANRAKMIALQADGNRRTAADQRARAEGAASLLDKVPCEGAGIYAACPLLRQAVTARDLLLTLKEAEALAEDTYTQATAAITAIGAYAVPPHVEALRVAIGEATLALDNATTDLDEIPPYVEPASVLALRKAAGAADVAAREAFAEVQRTVADGNKARATHVAARAKREQAETAATKAQAAQVERARQEERRNALAASLATEGERAKRLGVAYEDERHQVDNALKIAAYNADLATNAYNEAEAVKREAARVEQAALRDADRAAHALEEVEASAAIVAGYETKVAGQRRHVADYERLEQALRDAPVLVLESVIPDIEARANELLQKMSVTGLQVRLDTQRASKDAAKTLETLDVVVTDDVGERPRDLYSGGEGLRCDLALRLALSDVLHVRGGAAMSTMICDEGLSSLDAQGRADVPAAILGASDRFGLTLVVSHLTDVQDAFPVRAVVTKTADGSKVEVQ